MPLQPYAGAGSEREYVPPDPVPNEDATRLRRAEAELERLRGIVRNQEQVLRCVGRVLRPYLNRI
jgi:hypothetical protein